MDSTTAERDIAAGSASSERAQPAGTMSDPVAQQHEGFEEHYGKDVDVSYWDWHSSADKATRLQTDRLLDMGLDRIEEISGLGPRDMTAITVCGGVGGEATHLKHRRGYTDVTNSDFSAAALNISHQREPDIPTIQLNAEAMDLPDNSYDLVVVSAGLHHLGRPVLGFTEMLRVARKAVLVLEPHTGFITNTFGQEWEQEAPGTQNYVFRWDQELLEQTTRAYLLKAPVHVEAMRTIHHALAWKTSLKITGGRTKLMYPMIKAFYGVTVPLFGRWGNAMVGVVVKEP